MIETWDDLAAWIQTLTPEQRKQKVMYTRPVVNYDEVIPLHSIIAGGTVEEMFADCLTRSSDDNVHHPEQCILITDDNPFTPEGDAHGWIH